jgi:hypothetical protein
MGRGCGSARARPRSVASGASSGHMYRGTQHSLWVGNSAATALLKHRSAAEGGGMKHLRSIRQVSGKYQALQTQGDMQVSSSMRMCAAWA